MTSDKANDISIGIPPRRATGRQAKIRGKAGITTNPERRKNEWEREYPNMSNWQAVGPFLNRKDAQEWEDKQVGYEKSPGGKAPNHPFFLWYGYRFDYTPKRRAGI